MDVSALGGCHQPIHPVPKRSSVSSEHSSKFQFSGLFSFIPARAPLFCFGMLVLLLTLPCTYCVEALIFAFNGFQESDVYMVSDSHWTFVTNTSGFYFDPPEASWNRSVPGRFLYPYPVQMKDPVTKRVKSFSTSFIYQIQIRQGLTLGPGMSFIVVPDNVTVGAALDYMGLLTTDTSTSARNYESDKHTLGVELDTFMNPEFGDPNANHIGVNLASMLSTFTVNPVYTLASVRKDVYMQIWIDYSEADSRMDISIALYGEGKPVTPQGSQTGVDLSLLLENMYIGFSTAKGTESDNVPYVFAWSFSNEGVSAPPIVMGLDATSTSLPAVSMANPPSPSTEAPGPTPTGKEKGKGKNIGRFVGVSIGVILVFLNVASLARVLYKLQKVYRRQLHICISYTSGLDGSGRNFPMWLMEEMKSKFSCVKIFLPPVFFELSASIAGTIINSLVRFEVGIVVVTKEYFESKQSMIELIAFVEAQKNDPKNRIHIIPLFYELTCEELKAHLDGGTWKGSWKEMARGLHPIEVERLREAVMWLLTIRDISYDSHGRDIDKLYIDSVCEEIEKILCRERSFASILHLVFERKTTMTYTHMEKKRKRENQRIGKEIGVMVYINKLLRLLFAFSGLLIILLSVILDNSFNDKPIRFTAFVILAPIMIFLGFLASGWFPQIPLRFIALVKRFGFLQHVMPCCPWHDNVIIDFCGKICTLQPLVQDEGTRLLDFSMSVQNFLYGDQFPPQRTTHSIYPHSTLDSNIQDCQATTSPLELQDQELEEVSTLNQQNQDFRTNNVPNRAFMSEIPECPHVVITSQVSSPNLQETPSQVQDIVVEIDHLHVRNVLGDEQEPMLEFEGPKINGFSLNVQAFKNTSTRDPTFALFYIFRNKKTKRMNLTTKGLSNLVQNMCQWVEIPYPIVVNKSSSILHCMAIQDILWAFTKQVHTINSVVVEHRYLVGMEKDGSIVFLSLTIVTLTIGIIPLVWEKKSYWFLMFLIVLVPIFMLRTKNISYYFRSIFCPIYVKFKDFRGLYKSKSSLIWCNEFRKKRIVNPKSFWIDQEYANKLSDADSCFDTSELVILPGNPFKGKSFKIACQGWPRDDPKKQHDYELEFNFETFNPSDTCYTSVKLSFSENGDHLGTRKYASVEIPRLQLIEQLFYCYSNPYFGGYVEAIRPCSWSQSYWGNCCRFLDICNKIITDETMPTPWEATTKSDSQFIIGVPF